MDLKLTYRIASIPIIKQAILDNKNKSDIEQQLAIRALYPYHISNQVANVIWEAEVVRLRNEFYKHRKFL